MRAARGRSSAKGITSPTDNAGRRRAGCGAAPTGCSRCVPAPWPPCGPGPASRSPAPRQRACRRAPPHAAPATCDTDGGRHGPNVSVRAAGAERGAERRRAAGPGSVEGAKAASCPRAGVPVVFQDREDAALGGEGQPERASVVLGEELVHWGAERAGIGAALSTRRSSRDAGPRLPHAPCCRSAAEIDRNSSRGSSTAPKQHCGARGVSTRQAVMRRRSQPPSHLDGDVPLALSRAQAPHLALLHAVRCLVRATGAAGSRGTSGELTGPCAVTACSPAAPSARQWRWWQGR